MDPPVYAELMTLFSENALNHLRMEDGTDRRDEKARWHVMLVEDAQDAWQSIDGSVLAPCQGL